MNGKFRLIFSLVIVSAITFLAGCAQPSKTTGMMGGDPGAGGETLPGAGQEESLNGTAIPARPEGVNPETDVDYTILATETVYFDFDSSSIRSGERGKLENVAKWMTANPGRRLMLGGHTDRSGTAEYNRGLGERRSLAVRDYLRGLGVPTAQLFTISYGEDKPASMGTSDAENAKNRRVEPGVFKK